MPWLSTPCRSAQERMSAVASALSSGMPQAKRMALSCARCLSYGAGMGLSSSGRRPALRNRSIPASLLFGQTSGTAHSIRRADGMDPTYFGAEQVTHDDRGYRGSRFSEVRDAIFANPYQKVWGGPGEPPLPVYDVTLPSVLRGALPFGRPYLFRQAVARGVDSKSDLRWGADRKGFRRIIHPNGICLTGLWEISEQTPYSGYFRTGSRALTVGRYSTCCKETRRGRERSLSLVGKLFPTTDPGHGEPLRTASFITQQDLGGELTDYINDAELHNAPNTTSWRRGFGVPILLVEAILFGQTDKQPTQRQLYQIAELDKPDGEPTRAPAFMRLLVDPAQPRVQGDALDFRDAIM